MMVLCNSLDEEIKNTFSQPSSIYTELIDEEIVSTHNYIDFDDRMIRKGAIRSHIGEKMIIPFNMRDGIAICEGKSNPDWNYSAPHGAGRVLSRAKAKEVLDMSVFKEQMKDIVSTSVNEYTLDEAPGAYKPMEEILQNIQETAKLLYVVKPILNMKDNGK